MVDLHRWAGDDATSGDKASDDLQCRWAVRGLGSQDRRRKHASAISRQLIITPHLRVDDSSGCAWQLAPSAPESTLPGLWSTVTAILVYDTL